MDGKEVLWLVVNKYSTGKYLLKANYLRTTLCKPIEKIIEGPSMHFPIETEKKINFFLSVTELRNQ